jgi:hypothetical protein
MNHEFSKIGIKSVVYGENEIYGLFKIRFLSAGWRRGMTSSYVVKGGDMWQRSNHLSPPTQNTPNTLSFRPKGEI